MTATALHIIPVEDVIEHTLANDCVCGPDVIRWMVTHYPLDKYALRSKIIPVSEPAKPNPNP